MLIADIIVLHCGLRKHSIHVLLWIQEHAPGTLLIMTYLGKILIFIMRFLIFCMFVIELFEDWS